MARVPHHPAIERSFHRPPEWRMNPATGEWVIVAPERSARPMMPEDDSPSPPSDEPCPFCQGNEERTPAELLAFRVDGSPADGPGWLVRTIPNQFPAVKPLGEPHPGDDGFYYRSNGVGRHELFVECPHHESNLAKLSVEQVRLVAQAWRSRFEAAGRDPSMRYAQLFKNHGGDAGASVEHAHSQMIATPMIPITVREELRFAMQYHEEHGECVYCELLKRERAAGVRQVFSSANFEVFVAYAGRQPFESWIVPRQHSSQFEMMTAAEADEFGTALWNVLRKMDLALSGPPYNLVFHSSPFHEPPLPYYHWHVEVLPRLTQLAGYEWGTGAHINPILPEDAAEVLRDAAG